MLELLDTFPSFLSYWATARHQPLDAQMAGWAGMYLAPWPELFDQQATDYAEQGQDWRSVAVQHVFPFLDERLPAMQQAHTALLSICPAVFARAQTALGFSGDIVMVLYVGAGCGAGWATIYQGKPAILFGLENIAEEGWQTRPALEDLAAHELSHLIHFAWRAAEKRPPGEGPWWQLYTEGFAQRGAHCIQGHENWHMAQGQAWCQANQGRLGQRFRQAAETGQDIRPFFGSWFDIDGKKQCGYYLGHECIRHLETRHSLREIAILADWETAVRQALAQPGAWTPYSFIV